MSKLPDPRILGNIPARDTVLIFKVFSVLVLDCPDLEIAEGHLLDYSGNLRIS
jgi:hypothetical protein